ncbi:MAG: glycosyltransferase [Clostridia bacterium]|nr:glycosyltransferase [Clostridia bacterium]
MNNKPVFAVVVTYNRKELLRESVEALLAIQNDALRILVVDNASTDGTKEHIADLLSLPSVLYENTGENLGGAGGFSYGIRRAVELGAYYIWLMDDDCVVSSSALDGFLRFAEKVNDDFGFLSGVIHWTDGSICKMNIQRTTLSKEISDFSKTQRVKLASFVSFFITTKTVEEMGLPYRDFFIWGDDWEYTSRISAVKPCYMVADSLAVHKSKNNIGADIVSDTGDRLDRYFYAYRNEGFFYYNEGFKGKLYFTAKKLFHRLKILFSKTPMKKEKLAILRKGAKAAKHFSPKKEYVFCKDTKVRVLEFFGEPLSYGGQEAFILNMARNFEDKQLDYTFATPFGADNAALLSLIEQRDYGLIHLDYAFDTPLRKIYTKRGLKKILEKHDFDVIHIHSGSLYTLLHAAKIAKKKGIKRVLVHSHAAGGSSSFKYRLIKADANRRIEKYVDGFLACSEVAAERKYPPAVIEKKQFAVINNGIDGALYTFTEEKRQAMRDALGLSDKLAICHIGRFAPEKNHAFLIEVAKILAEKTRHFRLLLVGEGEGKAEMEARSSSYGLSDVVSFLGRRDDVADILMASDVFVLPSLFEGLPVSAVEAQATGLPTLCADTVTPEVNFSDLFTFLPIESPALWAEAILQVKKPSFPRESYAASLKNAHFDAKESASLLEKIYLTGQIHYE